MLWRALLLSVLTLALLAPPVGAERERGPGREPDAQGERGDRDAVIVTLASGQAEPGAGDPRVTVSGPGIGDSQAAVVCVSRPAAWAEPLAGSAWVSVAADCAGPAGEYRYTIAFFLPEGLEDPDLTGWVLADDVVRIELNGQVVFTDGGFTTPAAFAAADDSWFAAGVNTLTFVVTNAGGPTGLDFVATVTAGAERERKESHGACVSAVARGTPPGPGHGAAVRAAAHDCPQGED